MAQQKGMKRAAKVLKRKQRKAKLTKETNIRKAEHAGHGHHGHDHDHDHDHK